MSKIFKRNLLKRVTSIIMVATLVLGLLNSSAFSIRAKAAGTDAVTIQDENLRKVICKALGKEYTGGIEITEDEMASLKELDASNSNITDLTGMEKAVNLEKLDLSGNPIDEANREQPQKFGKTFKKLAGLTKIKILNLSNCKLGDNYCGYSNASLKYPSMPDELIYALEAMTSLEELDLSNNNITGAANFYIGLNGFNNLKKLDLSHNRFNIVQGIQTRFMQNLSELNLDDNYLFWDERDGNWHQALMNSDSVKVSHNDQKNLADLYAVYYISNGNTSSSYSDFTTVLVDNETKVIDLGTLCGGSVTIVPAGFANTNSTKLTINDKKVTVSSLYDLSTMVDANYQYVMTDVADGEYEYKVDVMHMGEDKQTYTLKFKMTSVPEDSTSDESAGIKDINLQYAVCKQLGIKEQVSSHVVTKSEMASLKSLSVYGVHNAEGIQYATNLTSLGLTGDYETLPDISALNGLKTLTINSTNLKTLLDLSNMTKLTGITVSETVDGKLPDLSNQVNLTKVTIANSKTDIVPNGLEACNKITSFIWSGCSGKHTIPNNIVTPKGSLSVSINASNDNAEYSFAGIENDDNVTKLTISYYNTVELKNVKITGIDEKTTALTSFGIGNGAVNSLVPDGIGKAPNLTKISITGAISELPASLENATNITEVILNNALKLPEVVGKITSVTNLSMQGVSEVAEDYDFSKLTSLTKLTIIDGGLTVVPSADKLPVSLEKLDLHNCKIYKMGATGYDKLVNLTSLNLSYNNFAEFPKQVSEIPNLTEFNIFMNYIGSIPENAFDNMTKLQSAMVGSLLPLQLSDDGSYVVDSKYKETKTAIDKLNEITSANGGYYSVDSYKAQYYGLSYAMLSSLDSDYGMITSSFGESTEAFKVLGENVTSITLKPIAVLPDTVITYNGKEYKSNEEIKIDNLVDGTNEITLVAANNFSNYSNTDTSVTYKIKLFCGKTISADSLEEGHTYRIDYKLYKSGLTVESMASGYFNSYAVVKYKNGKYDIKITTNKSSYISDMDYYNNNGERLDADLVEKDLINDTATYKMLADTLKERFVISPFVVPMGYYPKCDVVFDLNNIVDITDTLPAVDMSELNIAINEALDITDKHNIYTDDTYSALTKALENAQKIAEDKLASQEEADTALAELRAAIDGLKVDDKKLADKTALKSVIDEANAIKKGNHTDAAWNAFTEAISEAQAIYDNQNAMQSEVDLATKTLKSAITIFNNSGDASTLDKDNLEDGVYSVYVDMIKTDRANKSMSDNAINHTVKLEVKNGEYYITLDFKGITIENRFGYLKNLSYYEDGYTYGQFGTINGNLVAADVLSTQKDSDGNDVIDQYNDKDNLYPDLIRIKLVKSAIEDADGYVPLHVFVPIMEAIATGNGDQDVLMKIDWTSLKKTTEDDPDFKPTEPEEQSPALDVVDSATGIKVHADKGVFEKGVKLVVTPIESGDVYSKAENSLSEVGKKFKLYEIHFVNEAGQIVQPNGTVTVSYPIPDGYDAANVVLYRINEDGTKTLVKGVVEDGYYKVITKSFSTYALVEKGSTITDAENTKQVEETKKSQDTTTSQNNKSDNKSSVKTGDSAKYVICLMAMGLLAAASVIILKGKRKEA